jgi:hypothetical protein
MRHQTVLAAAVLAALATAAPASADREVFANSDVHSGLPGARPAAFFPAILGVSLAEYQAEPSLWAYCPDATDKVLLPNGANGSKQGVGVCMNGSTVIHIMTVGPGQHAGELVTDPDHVNRLVAAHLGAASEFRHYSLSF